MPSPFASTSEKEILSMIEEAVVKNTKMATKFLMVSYLISPASYYETKILNTMPCLRKLSSTKITMKTMKHLMFSAWFQQPDEFNSAIEEMTPQQRNKCLQKFCLSARRRDGTFYNEKSLTAIRAALDRHLKSPPLNKPFSIIGPLFIQLVCHILKQLFTSVSVTRGGYLPSREASTSVNYC